MQDNNIVRDIYVSDGSRTIKASYFVEAGIIHANAEGRTLTLPVSDDSTEETVRRLIIGQVQTKTWRERMAARWRTWQDRR